MKNQELKLLKDKCLFYTRFVIQKLSGSPELIKGLEETSRLVEKAYQDEKIKPLKAMSAEIDDQVIRHMPLSMAVEFKNLIKEKLKIAYDDVDKAHLKIIERILKKEKISNTEEYKLIVSRIDEIFTDVTKAQELRRLNALLVEYENQKK
jgi:hypothetical protein